MKYNWKNYFQSAWVFLCMEQYTVNTCKSSVRLSPLPAQLSSIWTDPGPLSGIPHQIHTLPFLSWCERGLHQTCRDVLFPVNVIPALIGFPRRYLCRLFLPRTNSKHVCLWSTIPGRTVIYSLNRAFVLAGKKISEVPGWDRVSVIPWARRRLSGSPGGGRIPERKIMVHVNASHVCQLMRKHVFS